jgi:hypothetical protein
VGGGVQLGTLGTSATDWPIVPAPGDYDDGEFGGIKIGRGNRSTRRKPAPAPLCTPQIPLENRARTRAAAVGSRQLTAWAMARLSLHLQCRRVSQTRKQREAGNKQDLSGMSFLQYRNNCCSFKIFLTEKWNYLANYVYFANILANEYSTESTYTWIT